MPSHQASPQEARRAQRRRLSTPWISEAAQLLFAEPDFPGAPSGVERLLQTIIELDDREGGQLRGRALRKAARLPTRRLEVRPESSQALAKLIERRWGADYLNISNTLQHLEQGPPARLNEAKVHDWFLDNLVAESELAPDAWFARQRAGLLAEAYIQDLADLAEAARTSEPRLSALLDEAIIALVDHDGLEASTGLETRSESTLVVGLHAGALSVANFVSDTRLPSSVRLAAGSSGGLTGVRSDPTRALMEMVRHLRKTGGVAVMRADGGFKGATIAVPVRGVPLIFGAGGAHAAYFARCRCVFSVPRWSGDRVLIDLTEAPRAEPDEKIDNYTARWCAAFGAYIETLLREDPRNMRGRGVLWVGLARVAAEAS